MASLDRLHQFAQLLCTAIPDLDIDSLSPRPVDDPSAPMHVGRLETRGGGGAMRALFAVSDQSSFVPLAFTSFEDTEVGISLASMHEYVGAHPAPPVGSSFNMGSDMKLAQAGVAGTLLLMPTMLSALSMFEDGVESGGERFDTRLVVFVDKAELAASLEDFPALMQDFDRRGRSVFLEPEQFALPWN
jgi:hypothetical protein